MLVSLLVLAACGDEEANILSTTSTSQAEATSTSPGMTDNSVSPKPEPPSSLPSDLGGGPQDLVTDASPPSNVEEAVEVAVADLSTRLGIQVDEIDVAEASKHTWSDGSIGCPEPGRMYTQALTPGFRVILASGEDEYAYHGATGRSLFYCPSPSTGSGLDR